MSEPSVYDLAIIGGGINGCGIARDAAGRGLSVFLCEQNDLSSGTSSASTKLIHGGLRYLEYYEFRLVREALKEREVLLNAAPHIIWPLRFILPHHRGLRPAWLIRLGLLLYDNLGGRKLLPATTTIDLGRDEAGAPLKKIFTRGFEYSDCWVMDSRLVVLNAMDAAANGAQINTRSRCLSALRQQELWKLQIEERQGGKTREIRAKVVVNATGPWLDDFLTHATHKKSGEHIRMVKGSHIIVGKIFSHPRSYIFQNEDGRIIFAIPYEKDFTLIGTTDVDFHGDPGKVSTSQEEIDYLCRAASEYFIKPIVAEDVVHTYSGVRPLFDDGESEAKAATRDYVLKIDGGLHEAPMLSIYGGKITTYRKLAEAVLKKLRPYLPAMGEDWTEKACLPGGDFSPLKFQELIEKIWSSCPVITREHAARLTRYYGTRAFEILKNIKTVDDLGTCFGADLFEAEVRYLLSSEWAQTAEDVLRRRSNLGLLLTDAEKEVLDIWIHRQH